MQKVNNTPIPAPSSPVSVKMNDSCFWIHDGCVSSKHSSGQFIAPTYTHHKILSLYQLGDPLTWRVFSCLILYRRLLSGSLCVLKSS